ncbi:MAG: helix-turn-helix domain-containing protein [Actinomycetaceae bacterium]|nr:helix-turn-helix domain-containing protein [Actinomycetaceae bacterium]MDY6082557.1 helix-turn-helix domain-containing protein [Actinomycetaceae bacterium]
MHQKDFNIESEGGVMSVAAEIRAEAARQKIPMSEISARSGISEVTLWRKISQEITPLDTDQIEKISQVLGVRASTLVRRAEEAVSQSKQAA